MARIIPIPIGPIYPGGPCRGIIHVIQKGDTLYQLGKRYHVSVAQLMCANPFVDVYNLQIGDELCIPAAIQPRDVGAEERLQYRNEREDWEAQTEQTAPQLDHAWDNHEDVDIYEDWKNYGSQGTWENRNTPTELEDWENAGQQDSDESWGDWQDREDWNHKDKSEDWED